MTRLVEVGSAAAAEAPQATAAPTQVQPPRPSPAANQALALLLLAVKTIGQRALIAATNAVTLIGLASAFWLWLSVLPNPSTNTIVALALYGLLLIGLRWIWRS